MADATVADLLGDDLLCHWDASDATSVWTDTGGTSQAGDGDDVKGWSQQADASQSGLLTEATNPPVYDADYDATGYPAVVFDGTNQKLFIPSTGIVTGAARLVLSVITHVSGVTNYCFGNANSQYLRLYYGSVFQGSGTSVGLEGTNPAKQCVAARFDAPWLAVGQSAGVGGTTGMNAGLTGAFTLGALNQNGGFSQYGACAVHEVLLIAGTCEFGQVVRCSKLLASKWGTTDNNATPQVTGGLLRVGMNGGFGG